MDNFVLGQDVGVEIDYIFQQVMMELSEREPHLTGSEVPSDIDVPSREVQFRRQRSSGCGPRIDYFTASEGSCSPEDSRGAGPVQSPSAGVELKTVGSAATWSMQKIR